MNSFGRLLVQRVELPFRSSVVWSWEQCRAPLSETSVFGAVMDWHGRQFPVPSCLTKHQQRRYWRDRSRRLSMHIEGSSDFSLVRSEMAQGLSQIPRMFIWWVLARVNSQVTMMIGEKVMDGSKLCKPNDPDFGDISFIHAKSRRPNAPLCPMVTPRSI